LVILRNSFINAIHREGKYLQTIYLSEMNNQGIELPDHDNPEDIIFGSLLSDDVTAALNSLPAKYRAIILLADIEGFSYRDIADKINCPIGTVMSRLSRGRRLLRKKLKVYALEHGYKLNGS
jgi:RNA polymerase sigma-70 factor (ECF subfamily)